MNTQKGHTKRNGIIKFIGALAAGSVSFVLTLALMVFILLFSAGADTGESPVSKGAILDRFDMYITNVTSEALDGILTVEKVFWLRDEEPVAPRPDPDKYIKTDDPRDLEKVLEEASELLDGQTMLFTPDTQIRKGSEITCYLDDTILCITWQKEVRSAIYTYSEVKIAHPSQFRRFLSDGKFGSGKLYHATEMAASVNAVTASNGDYYAYRGYGNLVYNGEVKQAGIGYLDTCYVDENGDLIMMEFGRLYREQDVQAFVEENKIRFSLTFGPILVKDGKNVVNIYYPLGEPEETFSRAALCQIGPLHYMFVAANHGGEELYWFSRHLQEIGVLNAYALDGGQTATLVTGNELMNPVDYGGERETSDIVYFATAVPDGG